MVDPLDGSLLNRFSSVEVEANFVFMQLIGNESETSEHGQHDGKCGTEITTFYYIHSHTLYHTYHVARCVQQIFVPRMLFFFVCTFSNIASTDLRDDWKRLRVKLHEKLLHHCPNRMDRLKNLWKINQLIGRFHFIYMRKKNRFNLIFDDLFDNFLVNFWF